MSVLVPDLLWRAGAFRGGLAVEVDDASGRIAAILETDGVGADALRLRGRALLPGFVNAHTHSLDLLLRVAQKTEIAVAAEPLALLDTPCSDTA